MERQSLTLTVATYLQTEASHEESHTAQGDCDGLSVTKCLSLLTTCRGVLKELPPSAIVEETQVYLNQLEVTCLIRINDSTLLPKLKEYSSSHLFSFSFFLDMYYILEQENSKDTGAKKECLRTALQVLLQQPSFSLTSVCEVIHCLLLVCESKIEEYHWIEQLLQIVKTYGEPVQYSLLCYFMYRNSDQFAFFTVQMWNCGVYYQRMNNMQEAERFMSIAIQMTSYCQETMKVRIRRWIQYSHTSMT